MRAPCRVYFSLIKLFAWCRCRSGRRHRPRRSTWRWTWRSRGTGRTPTWPPERRRRRRQCFPLQTSQHKVLSAQRTPSLLAKPAILSAKWGRVRYATLLMARRSPLSEPSVARSSLRNPPAGIQLFCYAPLLRTRRNRNISQSASLVREADLSDR